MHWIWWIVIGFFVLLALLLIAKIKIKINYFHDGDNDELSVKISTLFGLASYKINVPVLKINEESPAIIVEEEEHSAVSDKKKTKKITPETMIDSIKNIKDFLVHVVGFHKIVKRFLNHISISAFKWKTILGVADAAATGTLVGALWGVKGSTLGIISNYMKLQTDPIIEVHPTFQQLTSHTELSCIFSFRLGYAIYAALQIAKHWKKRPKFSSDNLYSKSIT